MLYNCCSTLKTNSGKYFNSRKKGILEILSEIDVDNGDTFSKILSDKHFTKEGGIWSIVAPQNISVKIFMM